MGLDIQKIISYFPEIKGIHFDECCSDVNDISHYLALGKQSFTGRDAHTHMCPEDINYHHVCFSEDVIYNNDGSYSDAIWHEYGHVLDNTKLECLKSSKTHQVASSEWDGGHHEPWRKIMEKLGKPTTKMVVIR